MNKNILHMQEPLITAYPTHANTMSMLSTIPNSMLWYYENYMLLYSLKTTNNSFTDYFAPIPWRACPFIESQNISRETIAINGIDFIQLIKNAISTGWYIFLYLNHYYLPFPPAYKKIHMPHDTFIYGYDEENNKVYVADTFINGRYSFETISFEEVENAYHDIDLQSVIHGNVQGVILMRPKNLDWYIYDINKTKELIYNQLNCKPSLDGYSGGFKIYYDQHKDEYTFGLNVYNCLKEYINKPQVGQVDIRGFYMLYAHKTFMLNWLEYANNNGLIRNAEKIYKQGLNLQQKSIMLQNILIKFSIKKTTDKLLRATHMLDELKKEEEDLLCLIYSSIKS